MIKFIGGGITITNREMSKDNKNNKNQEKNDRKIPFIISSTYLLSLLFIRVSAHIAGSANSEVAQIVKQSGDLNFYIGRNIILFGYHIHHFYFGILMIALAGWFSITGTGFRSKSKLAAFYGIGLGLLMDEIGLLLTWGDYYSSLTYILSIFLLGIFLNIIFFPYFWETVKEELAEDKPHLFIWDTLLSHKNILRVVDKVSEKTGKTEKFSLSFIGIIYIVVGILIILYPNFVYYWVSGVFILQGLSSLVRAWMQDSDFDK